VLRSTHACTLASKYFRTRVFLLGVFDKHRFLITRLEWKQLDCQATPLFPWLPVFGTIRERPDLRRFASLYMRRIDQAIETAALVPPHMCMVRGWSPIGRLLGEYIAGLASTCSNIPRTYPIFHDLETKKHLACLAVLHERLSRCKRC
jgi:hypothetical protein